MEKINVDIGIIEKLLQSEPSEKYLFLALKQLKTCKENKKQRKILLIICLCLGGIVGFNSDTLHIYVDSVESIQSVILGFFGTIFTGYSLLQAFMNKKMLAQLLSDKTQGKNKKIKSRLQDINENFLSLMLLMVVHIIGTLVIKIITSCISADYCLLPSVLGSDLFAVLLISIYYNFTGIILCRIISFLATVYHLFNIYAVTRLLELLENE